MASVAIYCDLLSGTMHIFPPMTCKYQHCITRG